MEKELKLNKIKNNLNDNKENIKIILLLGG
jgi:hypothetical protein